MCICSKFPVKCEASYNNNYCKSILFYAVRAGTEQEETVKIINNAETVSSDKKKKQYVGL